MAKRIESVDLLRGITIAAMILVNTPGDWNNVYGPLLHANWHGLTPTDLIFPIFLFIVGISISFAYKNAENNKHTYKKITIRSLKLFGLGLFLSLFLPYLPFVKELSTARIPGVLQRIGLVFFFTSILFLNFKWKTLLILFISILIAYWLLLGFAPLPNGAIPTFDRSPNNWANYLDLQLLGKHMWKPDYDPEGIFSTIPSIATCISGVLIGKLLALQNGRKEILLLISGLLFLGLGYLWNLSFPINKAIWSSSFVLVTSGWATIILSVIYYITDVKQLKFGKLFKYVGMNAITIYFLSSFISKTFYLTKIGETNNIHSYLYATFFTTNISNLKLASLLYATTVICFYLFIGYVMFKKKWIVKV